ncbi:MAG: hypothetical protein QM619_00450 [Micropruina sp.]|uniref:hypothetical protein n=1 Tax=Micropruina sp. TaxID=2737536 RepID=UPI0039E71BBC
MADQSLLTRWPLPQLTAPAEAVLAAWAELRRRRLSERLGGPICHTAAGVRGEERARAKLRAELDRLCSVRPGRS